jgi:hypothetical protein
MSELQRQRGPAEDEDEDGVTSDQYHDAKPVIERATATEEGVWSHPVSQPLSHCSAVAPSHSIGIASFTSDDFLEVKINHEFISLGQACGRSLKMHPIASVPPEQKGAADKMFGRGDVASGCC